MAGGGGGILSFLVHFNMTKYMDHTAEPSVDKLKTTLSHERADLCPSLTHA